jgi:hypothetical protein
MGIWCALILIGVCVMIFATNRNTKPGPTATRFLPANTFLTPGDLQISGFTGRYVVSPIGVQKDAELRSEDVGDAPLLTQSSVKLMLSVPILRSAVQGGVNAGRKLQLCGTASHSFGSVSVLAVHCNSADLAESCSAVVEVPGTAAGDLADKGLKDQTSLGNLHLAAACG